LLNSKNAATECSPPSPSGRLSQATNANKQTELDAVIKCERQQALEGLFIDRMDQNEEITAQYLNNKDFQTAVGQNLLKKVYEQIHKKREKEWAGV